MITDMDASRFKTRSLRDSRILRILSAGLRAVDPAEAVRRNLPDVSGKVYGLGIGKASIPMLTALVEAIPLSGALAISKHASPSDRSLFPVLLGGHPVPNLDSLRAGEAALEFVSAVGEEDTLVCLISGGGSALLPLPIEGLTLEHKQSLNRALLNSGASINEMNCVRRHLSAIKGGRLAAACHPARVLTLAISDVPGDDPINIASGPTVPDPTICADALAIVRRYGIDLPREVREVLESGRGESIKPGDPRLARAEIRLIATPQMALDAASKVAREAGVTPLLLGDAIEGEAREVGKVMAGIARSVAQHGHPVAPPCVLLSGGETTVTVRGGGRGGRNVEFLLALAVALDGAPDIWAIAGDTDGVDGAEEVAGAIVAPDTLARAWAKGIRAVDRLAENDGHGFFAALAEQVITGPTLTNVNDFRALLIL